VSELSLFNVAGVKRFTTFNFEIDGEIAVLFCRAMSSISNAIWYLPGSMFTLGRIHLGNR